MQRYDMSCDVPHDLASGEGDTTDNLLFVIAPGYQYEFLCNGQWNINDEDNTPVIKTGRQGTVVEMCWKDQYQVANNTLPNQTANTSQCTVLEAHFNNQDLNYLYNGTNYSHNAVSACSGGRFVLKNVTDKPICLTIIGYGLAIDQSLLSSLECVPYNYYFKLNSVSDLNGNYIWTTFAGWRDPQQFINYLSTYWECEANEYYKSYKENHDTLATEHYISSVWD